jgi:hypothetical protein
MPLGMSHYSIDTIHSTVWIKTAPPKINNVFLGKDLRTDDREANVNVTDCLVNGGQKT